MKCNSTGNLSCEARFTGDKSREDAELSIADGLEATLQPLEASVHPGDNATFTCVTNNDDVCIDWYINNNVDRNCSGEYNFSQTSNNTKIIYQANAYLWGPRGECRLRGTLGTTYGVSA